MASKRKEGFLPFRTGILLSCTKGGGQFFGKVGSFETGYELDAIVVDDRSLCVPADRLSTEERVERVIHLADDRNIISRFVAGEQA